MESTPALRPPLATLLTALLTAAALLSTPPKEARAQAVPLLDPEGAIMGYLGPMQEEGELIQGRDGARFRLPPGWRVDETASPAGTLLTAGPGARIWIFVQNLEGLPASAREYVLYGNRSVLREWSGMKLWLHRRLWMKGKETHVLAWRRPALRHVPPPDRYLYKEYDLIFSPRLVVTLLLAASPPSYARAQVALHQVALSLSLDERGTREVAEGSGLPPALPDLRGWKDEERGRAWEEWQTRDELQWPLPPRGLAWGIYDPLLEPDFWQLTGLRSLERSLGTRFDLLMTYLHFPDPFPQVQAEEAAREGRLLMLTLQSWIPMPQDRVFETPATLMFELLDGKYDGYLREWAREAARWGRPFFFRLDNEMNADWSPWSAFHYGKDADLYIYAWRHVWEIFREEGAENAVWVWNPNDTSFPNWRWNHHTRYWPGGKYVDWVGLTAYNLGNAYPGNTWREFREAYRPVYDEYRRLYPGKPLLIAEFASHDGGGDKARWIEDMFSALKEEFPEIRFAVWWNGTDGARRYRFDSTPAAREAFARGIRDPYFVHPVRFEPRR